MKASLVEQEIGVDAVLLRDRRHRRASSQTTFDEIVLQRIAVLAPRVLARDDSLVHDVHLADYVHTSTRVQAHTIVLTFTPPCNRASRPRLQSCEGRGECSTSRTCVI